MSLHCCLKLNYIACRRHFETDQNWHTRPRARTEIEQRLLDSGVKRYCPNKLSTDNVNALFYNRLSARDGSKAQRSVARRAQRYPSE